MQISTYGVVAALAYYTTTQNAVNIRLCALRSIFMLPLSTRNNPANDKMIMNSLRRPMTSTSTDKTASPTGFHQSPQMTICQPFRLLLVAGWKVAPSREQSLQPRAVGTGARAGGVIRVQGRRGLRRSVQVFEGVGSRLGGGFVAWEEQLLAPKHTSLPIL